MVIALNGLRRLGIKTRIAVRMANSKDHDPEFVVNARTAYSRAGQRRVWRNLDFLDQHLICAGTITGDVKEIKKVRTEEALGNAMARSRVRRDNDIGAGG